MTPKIIKPFALGVISAYVFAALILVSSARVGLLPVQADVPPSALEATLLGSALHASVARHSRSVVNPVPPSPENVMAGGKVYRQMCSRCHGLSRDPDNTYGQSFYPPAPLLAVDELSYTEPGLFWIVKHGIRNTAMPAWGKLLSDDQIWQVVTFLRTRDSGLD